MADTDRTTHSDLFGDHLEADADTAGEGSVVYHESSVPSLDNESDDRSKTVLVNRDLVPDAGELLVDVVTYGPGVSVKEHYHEGTAHFFYVLEGEGVIEIEGEETPLRKGSVAWIGEGDRHRLFAREGEGMRVLEHFSNNDHEITFFGDSYTWKPEAAEGE